MTTGLCRKCGIVLDPWLREQGKEYHDPCAPDEMFAEPELPPGQASDHFALRLRDDLTDVIRWANRNSERSQQTEIGASEIGGECLRRLGYRISDIMPVNDNTDPWPSIVGTGIHMWLESAFNKYTSSQPQQRWFTEMTVHPSSVVKGHTDLYDADTFTVVDWKSKGTEEMREIRKGYVPVDPVQQVNLYALGHIKAGRRVDRVALAFVPRAGWLSGMYVWSAPYDEKLAMAALDRLNKVAAGLIYYKTETEPANWTKIPAAPSKDCSWCPWYNPQAQSASDKGCPSK